MLGIDYISTEYRHPLPGKEEEDKVDVKVWDTAGQERFHTITQQFYRQAQGMIIAFDLTNRKSFDNVRTWIDSIYKHSTDTSLPKVLVGNKVDLADAGSLRAVLKSEALKVANEHEITYFETSAFENTNIREVMEHIMNKVYCNLYTEGGSLIAAKESIVIGERH